MRIRPATEMDCPRIAEIWNPIIRDSHATFNAEAKTVDGLVEDLCAKARQNHPFLVAEQDQVLGFATYGQFRASSGYRHTMEHTIILAPEARGQGVGRRLMAAIEQHAALCKVHSLFAGVSNRNPEGVAFHAALGYDEVARLKEVGWKFDQWYDLVLMQKIL